MSIIVRIDVRKTEAEARQIEATQFGKQQPGLTVSVERAVLAVWNWAPEGSVPDVVASDADNEVWIVSTRM